MRKYSLAFGLMVINECEIWYLPRYYVGRDSAVGIATRYGLDGREIESWWGRDFSHPSTPDLRPTQPPVQRVPGRFPWVKGPWRGVTARPLQSSADVQDPLRLHGLLYGELYQDNTHTNFVEKRHSEIINGRLKAYRIRLEY